MIRVIFILVILLVATMRITAQEHVLKPGFDGKEYLDMVSVTLLQADSISPDNKIPMPEKYERVYRSPEVGLFNRWDLWVSENKTAVISIRGTTHNAISWFENYFAAMVAANGSLQINDSTVFNYHLASDQKASVHVGWLLALAYLAPTITQKIDEYSKQGIRDFIIMGHSQGAAISFLTTSYLYYLQKEGKIPVDIRFKTYCSAAPKPGNLYYVYDYDFITRNGWSFTVVNASDWVPETPFTVQTLKNFNPVNLFGGIDDMLKTQSFFKRVAIKHVIGKMRKPPAKAQSRYEKYLGDYMFKQVRKTLPQLKKPDFIQDNNYMRAGVPIVLEPDSAYKKEFPDNPKKIFMHHKLWPYYSMARRYYVDQAH